LATRVVDHVVNASPVLNAKACSEFTISSSIEKVDKQLKRRESIVLSAGPSQ
jgi:hypothetical protein